MFTAVALGSIPGQGAKIPQSVRRGQKIFFFCIDSLKVTCTLKNIFKIPNV